MKRAVGLIGIVAAIGVLAGCARQELAKKDSEIKALLAQVETLQKENVALKQQVEAATSAHDTLQAEVTALKTQIEEKPATETDADFDQKIMELEHEKLQAQKMLDAANLEVAKLRAERDETRAEIARLMGEVAEMKRRHGQQ